MAFFRISSLMIKGDNQNQPESLLLLKMDDPNIKGIFRIYKILDVKIPCFHNFIGNCGGEFSGGMRYKIL